MEFDGLVRLARNFPLEYPIKIASRGRGITSDTASKIRRISRPEEFEYVLHEHTTKRGTHYDLRLGDLKANKGYSWVLRKGLPEPGQKRLAVRTFDHDIDYFDFSGRIKAGYGAGTVRKADRGRVEVLEARPDLVRFVTIHRRFPREYLLRRIRGKEWIVMCTTPKHGDKKIPPAKPSFLNWDPDKIQFTGIEWLLPKLDGSFATLHIEAKQPVLRMFSHRPEHEVLSAIEYTPRFPQITYKKPPKDLDGTILRGEVIGFRKVGRKKKFLPARIISGFLNTSPEKARRVQKERGYDFQYYAFDVVRYKGKNVEGELPYSERYKLLEEIVKKLKIPKIRLMPVAKTPSQKEKIYRLIKEKKHPLTEEGVVLYDPGRVPTRFIKVKFRPTIDCKVVGYTEGKGRLKGKAIGALLVIPEGGRLVTHVGTGFTDAQRREIYKNWNKYKGKIAEISCLEVFPDPEDPSKPGKLRAPAFVRWHVEKNIGK